MTTITAMQRAAFRAGYEWAKRPTAPAVLTVRGETAALARDATGYAGTITIDGLQHRVHVTVTPTGYTTTTPAKWRRL